ncbi:MAG: cache domain-containing protein [Deltaproteobacteria bacterium]|nr:cache domain-containing protein [Deltaproteobacteria bacterium]
MKKRVIMTLSLCCLTCLPPLFAVAAEPPLLAEARQHISAEFSRLDAALKGSARKLGAVGLTGDSARPALAELCGSFAFAVDCAAVDARGRMVTVEPPPYRHVEGSDISAQPQVKEVIKKKKPVLSAVFRAVEGFAAADLEYPVSTPDGRYIGSVSLLFKPEQFLSQLLTPLLKGLPVDICVMDKKGRILYDADPAQIGQNLFRSPLFRSYPQLLKLGRRMAAEKAGSGSYRYKVRGENRTAAKNGYWSTVSLYGTEWRVVTIHVERGDFANPSRPLPSAAKTAGTLASFAREAPLVRALSRGDRDEALALFQAFYETQPGTYSIQWVDERGINRFGDPTENSLADYDYRQDRSPLDRQILAILEGRKKASLEAPLREGKTGIFDFVPVQEKERALGLLYTIRRK